jgi:hypothetical protein
MTVQQIQEFLNAKVPTCDSNGTQLIYDSAYGDTVSRATYSSRRGVTTPFTCLKDYSQSVPSVTNSGSDLCTNSIVGGTKTSAQIINEVSYACGINPQVLIVLLQKEQSLVTDDWPWPVQYQKATGYGCPDTAPCDEQYFGFFNQVYQAAKAFRRYEANPDSYNYKASRNNFIYYNPNLSGCSGSTVYIQNQATANLYIYTPYQPNTAALNNLYGTGDSCSAYGNRNFWRIYSDWFGGTLTDSNDPIGAFDSAQFSQGKITINGWGFDKSTTSSASIHVYINGQWLGAYSANKPRPDVASIFKVGQLTGFVENITYTTPGTHQICAWVVGDNIGAPNMGLGCKTVEVTADPIGAFDSAQFSQGKITINGWGFDKSTTSSASIHVYINGQWLGAYSANKPRPDVASIFKVGQLTGFVENITYTTPGTHQICAWVVGDNIGAPNMGLGCKTVEVTADPIGAFDSAQFSQGKITINGWGFDKSTTSSASIHVYINGQWLGAYSANKPRPDVASIFKVGQLTGFVENITYTTPGTHQICAWVVGDNIGAPNMGLGCKIVSL